MLPVNRDSFEYLFTAAPPHLNLSGDHAGIIQFLSVVRCIGDTVWDFSRFLLPADSPFLVLWYGASSPGATA